MSGVHELIKQVKDYVAICAKYPPWICKAAPMAFTAITRMAPNIKVGGEYMTLLGTAEILHQSYTTSSQFATMVKGAPQRMGTWISVRGGFVDLELGLVRAPLVSSSIVGAILQHKHGYIRDECACLREQVYPESKPAFGDFATVAMQRGTASEPMIMEQTEMVTQRNASLARPKSEVKIEEVGLQISLPLPYMGVSVDGEAKCYDPDSSTLYVGAIEMKNRAETDMLPYEHIKVEYYDQIQHTMPLQNLTRYLFTCNSTKQFSYEQYKFDDVAWVRHHEAIDVYYWKRLWPCILLKAAGLIKYPYLLPSIRVTSSPILTHPLFEQYGGNAEALMATLEEVLGMDEKSDYNEPGAKRTKQH
jgi:hypothetical protein